LTATRAEPRVASPLGFTPARLLRLELRRNVMPWLLPAIAFLFWFDTYRTSMGLPAVWPGRSLYVQAGKELPDFVSFVAAAAAWTGSRDRRRGMTEQVGTAALARWWARLAACAATTAWALLGYAGCLGALYGVSAAQHVPGSPPPWPLAVGAATVTAVSTLGYAAGVWLPSRFTAPVAAVVALLVLLVAFDAAAGNPRLWLAPTVSGHAPNDPDPQWGVFFPYMPDLQIVQTLFLVGLTVAAAGALGLTAGPRSAPGPRSVRVAAAALTAFGMAAAGIGATLAGTARVGPHGIAVPAVHDPAADRPLATRPACDGAAVPVCLNPVFAADLPAVGAAIQPVLAEVAGLPGAPTRVEQAYHGSAAGSAEPGAATAVVRGRPAMLELGFNAVFAGRSCLGPPAGCVTAARLWTTPALTTRVLRPTVGRAVFGAVERAVAEGLLLATGASEAPVSPGAPPAADPALPGSPEYAAAQRFAALPAATRHGWLAAHLPTLRAGRLGLADLP
jgi:hypothetical protein